MKKWCALCGEELNFDSAQGWVHQDEKEGDERCYCPTSTTRDWKAAERREEAEAKTVAGKFAKALGHIEAAASYLGQVNEQYDLGESGAELRLITEQGVHFCNPALDFWLQADLAEGSLKILLHKLQRVERFAPKEVVEA